MDVISELDKSIAGAEITSNLNTNTSNDDVTKRNESGLHKRRTHGYCDENKNSQACNEATQDQQGLTHFLREENYDRLYRTKEGVPRCVLVCDGGGLKGYMSIHILKGLETQLKAIAKEDGEFPNIELYQVFDLILGTSTGGLISIGLGKLRLTCDEIIKFYEDVGSKVFSTHSSKNSVISTAEDWWNYLYRGGKQVVSLAVNIGKLNTNAFEKVIKSKIKQYGTAKDENELMYNPNNSKMVYETKCGVMATLCNNNTFQNGMIIRSYNINREMQVSKKLSMKLDNNDENDSGNISESSDSDVERQASMVMDASVAYVDSTLYDPTSRMKERTKYDNKGFSECTKHFKLVLPGIHECKIWEAARATSAAPTYFEDMVIDMPKSMVINVIKRNICFTCNVGQNPLTKQFDFGALYFDKLSTKSEPKEILHKIAKDIYNLKYNKKDNSDKDENENKHNNNNNNNNDKPVTKKDIISRINNIFLPAIIDGASKVINGKKKKQEFKQLTLSSFNNHVFNVDYTLRFQDGGLASNSPLSCGYNESLRLWPDSDVVMLSIGCGVASSKNYFHHEWLSPNVSRMYKSLFGAKDVTGLFEMLSISACPGSDFKMQRMNPEVNGYGEDGGDLLSMDDYRNMKDWRKIGNQYAINHENELKDWAKFLYKRFKEKPEKHATNVTNNHV